MATGAGVTERLQATLDASAYNLLTINVAHVIIANPYCSDTESDECVTAIDFASTSCLVGAIVGQLTFGYVGDCVGSSTALRLTMALSILGALGSVLAIGGSYGYAVTKHQEKLKAERLATDEALVSGKLAAALPLQLEPQDKPCDSE